MQWMFDIVIEQMLDAGFINDWARARIYPSGIQAIPSGGFTKVLFDTTSFSNRVTVDFPNNRLVIQDAGYYCLLAYVSLTAVSDQKRVHVAIKVNGNWWAYGVTHVSRATVGNPTIFTGNFIYLPVGDKVDLWVYHDQGANRNTQATYYATWLAVHRLS